jgi:uncharacterized protein (TIGR00369 family)
VALLRTADQLAADLLLAFPPANPADAVAVEHLGDREIRLRAPSAGRQLRPGGSVSGPTQFALADSVAWLMTLAHLEPGRDALTAGITMQFLRRPLPAPLVGTGRLLKLGRRLSVTDVLLYSDGLDDPVAQATVTYAPI